MSGPTIDPEQPVAWRGIPKDTPVRASDGEGVGVVADVLGSDEEDIFHGILVHLDRHGHSVFVAANDVRMMTATHVDVALSTIELHALPKYEGVAGFELGFVGRFRRRPGWVRDR